MTNTIQQLYLHVEVNGTELEGVALQSRLAGLYQHWLLPAIEQVLDRLGPSGEHLYIDHLEITAGTLAQESLEADFAEAVAQALEVAIREKPAAPPTTTTLHKRSAQLKTADQVVWEAFLFFLRTGRLPWSFQLAKGQPLEQILLQTLPRSVTQPTYTTELAKLLTTKTARLRLAEQFSEHFLVAFMEVFTPTFAPLMTSRAARQLAAAGESKVATFKKLAQADLPVKSQLVHSAPEDEAIYIKLAGLVLLHPFLSRFFEAVGVVQNDKVEHPARALHLLHFLATGEETAPEYEVVLPKILCGLPPEAVMAGGIRLIETEKAEASNLLEAVIRHWEALKSTSPDGLREAFLQRPGKLSRRADGWLLQVERLGYDLLLESLPWNIAVLQLPWMPGLLWVEWI